MGQVLVDRCSSESHTLRHVVTATIVTLLSVLYASVVILLGAHPVAVVIALAPFVALFLFVRPLYALYLAIGAAIMADDKLTPWMLIHRGISELTRDMVSWLIISPLELLILIALLGSLLSAVRTRAPLIPPRRTPDKSVARSDASDRRGPGGGQAPALQTTEVSIGTLRSPSAEGCPPDPGATPHPVNPVHPCSTIAPAPAGGFITGTFFGPMVPFLLFIGVGLLAGMARGGDSRIALWEFRAILYIPAVYLAFCNLVRTRDQLRAVMWIVLLATGVDALLTSWTYFVILGRNLGNLRAITDHQTAIFFAAGLLFAVASVLYKGPRWQRLAALALAPITLAAFAAANRRAAYVALVIGMIVLLMLVYRDNRQIVLKVSAALAVLLVIYAGVFWNSSSFLAKPLQGIKSVEARPGTDDYLSNLYRVQEKWNIYSTITHNPLLGVGFGNKFEMAIQLDYWSSPFREYITHNSVVWIWMKSGAGGFIALLGFVGIALSRAARAYVDLDDKNLKPMLATGLAFVVMYLVYSYVDQGWDYKGMVYLGTVLGSYATAERVARSGRRVAQGARGDAMRRAL